MCLRSIANRSESRKIQEDEMHRIVMWVMFLGICAGASAATARDADGETSSRKIANEPPAKSDDSAKPEAREGEKNAVESELQDLRNLVHAQSDELQDLRKRLAAVEAGGAASKEVRVPPTGSPAAILQPTTSAAMSDAS